MPSAELLYEPAPAKRGRLMLDALCATAQAAGIRAKASRAYRGDCDWVLLYGPGEPSRSEIMRRHVAKGGRAIAFDLGYWNRDGADKSRTHLRVTIDRPHPQALVMEGERKSERFRVMAVQPRNEWDPAGHVVIAGIGRKAQVQYGADVGEWELAALKRVQKLWPGRRVVYRPKRGVNEVLPGTVQVAGAPIAEVLRGASLVVTWHSNVAVDSIVQGIPTVVRDGAAAAVCPHEIEDGLEPLHIDVRRRFLNNLAWFQWAPVEAAECWSFLRDLLEA